MSFHLPALIFFHTGSPTFPPPPFFFSSSLPFSFYALFSLFFFFLRLRTFRRYLLHPFFSRQNAFLRGIANIALDRRRTAPTKDTGNEVNAAAVFSVRNNDVRTSRSKLLAATAIKAARTYTLGHTYSENHAIPESRLAQGAGEVTTRTTTEMATR